MRHFFVLIIVVFFFCSCAEKKKNIVFYDADDSIDSTIFFSENNTPIPSEVYDNIKVEYETNEKEVLVPFIRKGGVNFIDVTINGEFTVPMILDSGCSSTLISIAEARYLYEKGCFSNKDVLGVAQSQIADGSISENIVISLKQLAIGGKIVCYNVKATVSNNSYGPLLLGNEVLDRVPSYSVDNVNNVIRFTLEE